MHVEKTVENHENIAPARYADVEETEENVNVEKELEKSSFENLKNPEKQSHRKNKPYHMGYLLLVEEPLLKEDSSLNRRTNFFALQKVFIHFAK